MMKSAYLIYTSSSGGKNGRKMKMYLVRFFLTITIALAAGSYTVFAGTLDDYYLTAFGERPGDALQKAVLFPAVTDNQPHCGTPLKHGLRRNWEKLEPSTRKTLAKQLAAPLISREATYSSPEGHFLFHYATSGTDAPSPPDGYTLQTWLATVAATFESVFTSYTATHGYRPPPVNGRYDVYLRDMASRQMYGQTTSTDPLPASGFQNGYGSYIEIDKDFTAPLFTGATNGPYLPLQSLQITAAHEFHHAIQYGYNYYFDIWYAEATSTWYEDELFDQVNQLYNYLPRWFGNSTREIDLGLDGTTSASGAGYSRWIFNRFLTERIGGQFVRGVWGKLAGINPEGTADIPMLPIVSNLCAERTGDSLGSAFFDFTKRVYTRDWTSHTNEIGRIQPYIPLNTLTTYPLTTAPAPLILPRYSFAFYRLSPSGSSPDSLAITLSASQGISATAFQNTGSRIKEFSFDQVDGGTVTIPSFNASDEVVLLLTNSTASDNLTVSFAAGAAGGVTPEPGNTASSGGGCFIATAAFGSYLHPQVKLLREFRDRHLVTNRPGRAFVSLYYRLSPPLAEIISRHEILRVAARLLLTPLLFALSHFTAAVILLIAAVTGLWFRRRYSPATAATAAPSP
ncbi:MAG: MXAN_6640 family putative metalloprotease [Desulfuromonadales bacterium]